MADAAGRVGKWMLPPSKKAPARGGRMQGAILFSAWGKTPGLDACGGELARARPDGTSWRQPPPVAGAAP